MPTPRAARDTDITQSIDAFRRILRELRLIARKSELATGLSPAQGFVLTVIADHPAASVNEIASATMTDRSSAAALVDRLEEQGYVIRTTSAADRRRAEVTITARGRRALAAAPPPPTIALIEGIRALTPTERRGLARGIAALTRTMKIADQPAGLLFEDAPRRRNGRR
jgi:DNA-binding MarR family transcriptional regulator